MNAVVVRNIHRADAGAISSLERLGVSTVHEAQVRTGLLADGAFGELLATSLKARGAKGVVLDMGSRDAAEISEMKFPLWSRAISAKGTVKASLGSVNVPVVCAGIYIKPGDIVVADDDGVVIVPRLDAAKVAAAGQDREKKEAGSRARLQKGELGLDMYGMRRSLEEKGLKYIDGPLD